MRRWVWGLFLVLTFPALVMGQGGESDPRYFKDFFLGHYDDLASLYPQTKQKNQLTFTRLIYNGRLPHFWKNWYTDYPKGDQQLIFTLRRLVPAWDLAPQGRAIPIIHPDLFAYPFVYSCEAGQMVLDKKSARTLREYLDRGGFWMIDDFWGSREWAHFEKEIEKVFPEHPIVDLPLNFPLFHCFYDINEITQVPNVGYALNSPGAPTWEQDGYVPQVKGIFDHRGRLCVLINFNSDLMDAVEWTDEPKYPTRFSTYAAKMFVNAITYALTH